MPRASETGSWECLGEKHTCVFPPGFEPDADVVRAIRRVCPNFVPMLVVADWKSPSGGVHRLRYYMLATWQPYETEADRRKHVPKVEDCDRPSDFPFVGGELYAQRLWCELWPEGSPEYGENRPPKTGPFDRDVERYIRQVYDECGLVHGTWLMGSVAEAGRRANRNRIAKQEAEDAETDKSFDDARMGMRDDRRQIRKCIDEGRWFAEPKDPQPYVEVRTPEPPASVESGAPA